MRCHDFNLYGYEVRHFGDEIVFHLELAGQESHVCFSGVELYHFVHAGGTIIFGIDEVPVSLVLDEFWERILHWAQQHGGVPHWDRDDRASYQAKIEAGGYKAWNISSSIGFAGFVIAHSIADVTSEFSKAV
ncbi:MAG: hypothetical protein NTY98_02455 [Verrucomicrobia bacterium]|nr:hypothetical protein [Verrucomicrobiota bacterium]